MQNLFFMVTAMFLLFACAMQKPVTEGIRGEVLWFEGDLMPGIDKPPVEGQPVIREIFFYAPTHVSQARQTDHVFYDDIETPLIKNARSDEQGVFEVSLDPGTYSVFIKEPEGLFANRFNEFGLINPVKVNPGEVTGIRIRIDYMAAY